jgi:tetratricopeptide (TPR) repeat protein
MMRKDRENNEEETRDLIERLGKLSSMGQAPPDFLSKVMTRADRLPFPRRGFLSGLTDRIIGDLRIGTLVLAGVLVILIIGLLGGLKIASDRLQTTSVQITQLKEELGKQRELMKALRRLIERIDRQAYADFKLGKYEKSWRGYLQAAKQEPEKKDVYRFRAALALWYDCQFRRARELLEKYIKEHDDDLWGHFALATTYHSLGNYQAAVPHYKKVIARDKGEAAEAAWFNLGVIQALEFQKSRDPRDLEKTMSYLEKSIELASDISIVRGNDRINRIQEGLKPISQRESMVCVENYAPDDLRSLSKEEIFLSWLQEKKITFAKTPKIPQHDS